MKITGGNKEVLDFGWPEFEELLNIDIFSDFIVKYVHFQILLNNPRKLLKEVSALEG
jgi:hypothetical protein